MKERAYYHITFSVARGKPVFVNAEIDAAFKALVRELARSKGWGLIELETMPTTYICCWKRRPGWI